MIVHIMRSLYLKNKKLLLILLPIYFFTDQKIDNNFNKKLSLYSPYLAKNGRSDIYSIKKDYVVITSSPINTYVQLGFSSGPTSGSISSKNMIEADSNDNCNFKLDIRFSVSNQSKGSFLTFALFHGKQKLYGFENSKISFRGILIVLFTEEEPSIAVEFGIVYNLKISQENMKFQKNISNELYGKDAILRLESIDENFRALLSVGNNNFEEVFSITNPFLENSHFMIDSTNKHENRIEYKIYGIEAFDLRHVSGSYKHIKIDSKKRNWFIWSIFFVTLMFILIYTHIDKNK